MPDGRIEPPSLVDILQAGVDDIKNTSSVPLDPAEGVGPCISGGASHRFSLLMLVQFVKLQCIKTEHRKYDHQCMSNFIVSRRGKTEREKAKLWPPRVRLCVFERSLAEPAARQIFLVFGVLRSLSKALRFCLETHFDPFHAILCSPVL